MVSKIVQVQVLRLGCYVLDGTTMNALIGFVVRITYSPLSIIRNSLMVFASLRRMILLWRIG